MNAEFFRALDLIEKEKGISKEYMKEKIEAALLTALKRDFGTIENVVVSIEEKSETIRVYQKKMVVEEITDPQTEILLEEALNISKKAIIGEYVEIDVETKEIGRISAQNAKQVIVQGIREAEREKLEKEYRGKDKELLTGIVRKIDPKNGIVSVEIGKIEGMMPPNEQIKGEKLRDGDRIKVYVSDIKSNPKGVQMILSRTHPGLIKRLFEKEVPEIFDGTVVIEGISREAGSRTKIAVSSNDPNVDPVGACIGPKRSRIQNIMMELNGEKIDLVKYYEDPEKYVASAISPADVIDVVMVEEKSFRVIVPDDQLSLAIGKEGQNAKLAARMTGFKIDIKPQSKANEE